MSKARRYNKEKPRTELTCPQVDMFKIRRYTKGADKYTLKNDDGEVVDDGANNWKKGMSFKKLIGSLKRHIHAIEMGEDIDWDWDDELNKKHGLSTHYDGVIWNAEALLYQYLNNYPDDRDKKFATPRIGLDLDGVVFNFNKLLGIENPPEHYSDSEFLQLYNNLLEYPSEIPECPVFEDALGMPFEPVVYITARPYSLINYTQKSIIGSRLPEAKIVHTKDKIRACRENKVEVFVEDKWETFCELNRAGIKTYLMDRAYNRKHDAGRLRIKSLKEVL